MKTILELEREGASAAAANNKLIEPVPRTITMDVRWLLNRTTGYIDLNHPLLAQLGDTIYEEYEPSPAELARLKAGQRVMGRGTTKPAKIDLSAAPSMAISREATYGRKVDIFAGADLDQPAPALLPDQTGLAALHQATVADAVMAEIAAKPAPAPVVPQPAAAQTRPVPPPGLFQSGLTPYKPAGKK